MKLGPIYGYAWRWGFWFRVYGYGLCVSNGPALFSERIEARKVIRVFGWKVEGLKPIRRPKPQEQAR